MKRITCIAAMVLIAVPAAAQQGTPAAGLHSERLDTVFVQDDRGGETRGKLLRLDQQAVTVLVDGEQRSFDLATVRRVQKRGDSLRNGAMIGALFGAALGISMSRGWNCDSYNPPSAACSAGARIAIATSSIGIYSAIGAGLDAAVQGRNTLYRRPATSVARAAGPAIAARVKVSW